MTTALDYALMAGASYFSTRSDLNRFPLPADWTERLEFRTKFDRSGFEAATFQKGTDVVISFAGTSPGAADWIHGNIPLLNGALSDQLRDAADYYLQVKASLPAGTHITLTGHSLGGGLAALIAVMFGETAVTFDQLPVRNAAEFYKTTVNEIEATRSAAQDLRAYLDGRCFLYFHKGG